MNAMINEWLDNIIYLYINLLSKMTSEALLNVVKELADSLLNV